LSMLRMKPKVILEVTPIFDIWTLFMGFCFMYSFTLTSQAENFYRAVDIFRWLYVVGFIMLLRSVILKDDLELTAKELSHIIFYMFVGILGLGFVNIGVSLFAKFTGMMAITDLVINTAIVNDLFVAFLAGYNEEIAFAAIYFLVYRLAPDKMIGVGRFRFNYAHVVTLWAVAMVFPIFHSIAYSLWGPAFVVLFIGRIVLTEVMVRSKRIEPSILAHAAWDIIVVVPLLFTGG